MPTDLANASTAAVDPTFGTDGVVTTDLGGSDAPADSVFQPDGKIVVVGSHKPPGTGFSGHRFALVRYNPNGSLDTGFGDGGIVTTSLSGNSGMDFAKAVAIEDDGQIVVVGNSDNSGRVVRYNSDGTLDSGFGDSGSAVLDGFAADVAIQGDDKIVIVGTEGFFPTDFIVSRLNADGTTDEDFAAPPPEGPIGGGGLTHIDFGGNDGAQSVALDPTGNILVGGHANFNSSDTDFAIARLDSGGELDPSFGEGGKVLTDFGGLDTAFSLVLTEDEGFFVSGVSQAAIFTGHERLAAARYLPSGDLDSSFGSQGTMTSSMVGWSLNSALTTDGKLLLGAGLWNPSKSNHELQVARLTEDGILDCTFGIGGVILREDIEGLGTIAVNGDKAIGVGGSQDFKLVQLLIPSANTLLPVQLLSEGATHSGFGTFVLLTNPHPNLPSVVNLTFLTPRGPLYQRSVHGNLLPQGRRLSVNVNAVLGVDADVATKVTTIKGPPVVAEVSMHKAGGGLATLNLQAANSPATSWILPEGVTHSDFATFVSLANSDLCEPARVDINFLTGSAGVRLGPQDLEIPPGGRRTVHVNSVLARSDDVSTRITTDFGSVVASVSVHKQALSDLGIGGSLGVTSTAKSWVVPEGATHSGWTTFVLVSNPGASEVSVDVTYLTGSQGPIPEDSSLAIPAGARRTINVNARLEALGAEPDDVSTLVQASSGTVAVESSIQKVDAAGFAIADSIGSGSSSVAQASGTAWVSAEGATHAGFATFILIANPDSAIPAAVNVSFLTQSGSVPGPSFVLPPGTRRTVSVDQTLPAHDVSTLVRTTSGKVVVEMAIDRLTPQGFSKGRSLAYKLTA